MITSVRDPRSLPHLSADALRSRILASEWAPGQQLPSEQSLADSMGVSRATIRAAIKILSSGGLVHVRRGLGTFVTERGPGVVSGLQELRSTTEILREQLSDVEVSYRLRTRRAPTEEEALVFEAEHPRSVIAIERCFASGGDIIAFERALINAQLLPADFDPVAFDESIFAVLRPMGLVPYQAIATVHACYDKSIAWPDTEVANPLYLCLTQRGYISDGRTITWSKTFFTEGNFEFLLVRS